MKKNTLLLVFFFCGLLAFGQDYFPKNDGIKEKKHQLHRIYKRNYPRHSYRNYQQWDTSHSKWESGECWKIGYYSAEHGNY